MQHTVSLHFIMFIALSTENVLIDFLIDLTIKLLLIQQSAASGKAHLFCSTAFSYIPANTIHISA